MGAQGLDGDGRGFEDVAELGVVADLQAGHAETLAEVELQRGDDAAAVVAQRALGVEFAVVAGGDDAAVVEARRDRVGQRAGQQVGECGCRLQCGPGARQGGGRGAVQRGGGRRAPRQGRRGWPPSRAVSRGLATAGQGARHIRRAAQRLAHGDQRGWVGDEPAPAILALGDGGGVGERGGEPAGQQRGRRAAVSVR